VLLLVGDTVSPGVIMLVMIMLDDRLTNVLLQY
jgi:hypothetical protein